MSNRSELLALVKTRLQAIRLAAGFGTHAGATIFMGEAPDLGPDDPPSALAILVGEDAPRYQGEQILLHLPVQIAALAKADLDDAWATIEGLLVDVKRAMEQPDRRFGNRLRAPLQRGSTRTLAREVGGTTIGVSVTYYLDYQEVWGNP